MKRSTVNFIVDLISFVDLLGMAFTGLIMKYILPPGTGGCGRLEHDGRGREQIRELWSLTRHEWGSIHYCLALLFIALMVVHIILHWAWIKSYFKPLFWRKKNLDGDLQDFM
ncbi:MAG: DUF4405 domain-containing protein [Planctomycetota bacterium]|jgi:hypothetical protein